mgnify:CR=1 FL=1
MLLLIQHTDLGIEMYTVLYSTSSGEYRRHDFTNIAFARRFIQLKFPHINAQQVELKVARRPIFSHNLHNHDIVDLEAHWGPELTALLPK